MRLRLLIIVVAGALGASPALSQEATGETRCWLGSVTFSSGAVMNSGSGPMVCEADVGWRAAEEATDAAGCLLEGDLSSVGAVVGISNNDMLSLQCGADGRWTTLDAGTDSVAAQ